MEEHINLRDTTSDADKIDKCISLVIDRALTGEHWYDGKFVSEQMMDLEVTSETKADCVTNVDKIDECISAVISRGLAENECVDGKFANDQYFIHGSRKRKINFCEESEVNKNNDFWELDAVIKSFDTSLYRLSLCNIECHSCRAKHFKEEITKSNKTGSFYDCCNYGDLISLEDMIDDYPPELKVLFDPTNKFHKNFIENIRKLNSNFSCASLQSVRRNAENQEVSGEVRFQNGVQIYKIQGTIYHKKNIVAMPNNDEAPTNAQLFFVDTEEAYKQRLKQLHIETPTKRNPIMKELVEYIDGILRKTYSYARAYKMMSEIICEEEKNSKANGIDNVKEVKLLFSLKKEFEAEKHKFCIPFSNEVCAVVVTDAEGNIPPADLVVHKKGDKKLINLPHYNKDVEGMCYPILNAYGTSGWSIELKSLSNKKITLNQYIRYKLFERNNDKFIPHFCAEKLFQQWLVDSYVKIEGERLLYIRNQQRKLKACRYSSLKDYLDKKSHALNAKIGRIVILPSSYTNSPRHKEQLYLDAMAHVAEFGNPHIFLTMTCNPNDIDILSNISFGNKAQCNPVMAVRVFKLKVKQLCHDLFVKNLFGKIKAYSYSVEFQKRDLPHIHMLLTLEKNIYKTPEMIDRIISAQIPNKDVEPELYDRVRNLMLHGPCQRKTLNGIKYGMCWNFEKNCCSKKYPREFREITELNENGYPYYARPNNARVAQKNIDDVELDNRYVVPYNPELLLKYNSHINVEIVASIMAVKYLYKYIFKGYDHATVILGKDAGDQFIQYDEIEAHINARYIGPMEAAWRLLNFELFEHSHAVEKLPVHLENEQEIYYGTNLFDSIDDDEENVLESNINADTKLMAYFKYNLKHQFDVDFKPITYKDFPKFFCWVKKDHKWTVRKSFGCKRGVLGRLHMVDPRHSELYHLRLLLFYVKGARSFRDMRCYNEIEYKTYKEACLARGLIQNDEEWFLCLQEASTLKFPKALRDLFVTILVQCNPIRPDKIWDKFRNDLTEDFINDCASFDERYNKGLVEIEKLMKEHGKSLNDFPDMPQLELILNPIDGTEIISVDEESKLFWSYYKKLNTEQKDIVDFVVKQINTKISMENIIFIDGPGGTGKTFIFMTLYHYSRAKLKNIENIAFSGIAATALKYGRTVHTAFKLPLNLNSFSKSNIELNSTEALRLKKMDIIVWDELPMAPKWALYAVSEKLQEIMENSNLFGNKVLVCAGDFRQLLPVVEGGTDNEIIDACVKSSKFWNKFKKFNLLENMRTGLGEKNFAQWLMKLGNGQLNDENNMIILPDECRITDKSLSEEIYSELIKNDNYTDFSTSCICAFYNSDVDEINEEVLNMMHGNDHLYQAINSGGKNILQQFPELLASIEMPSLPKNTLKLKKNCVVMLLRNLNTIKGMVNSTRIQINALEKNVIKGTIVNGTSTGRVVFIPRITLIEEKKVPCVISRHQFPIRLAMALTVHKTQSQTIKNLGIDLRKPAFAHGHIYTAFSRAISWNKLIVRLSSSMDRKIYNKVIKDILNF